ncbi:phosphate ABC transporter permease PstA [Pleomorphomonas sp. NRK KF1]|uniref:phosphate ABC transporter permease PstA n=1 Tax=Pleomorphomonas sp. NRK KF1 TaxID=2943000 RepID=UPI002042C0D8|nr:phosphate ABC transporter permease PstA [Pleomorphomonas sp. NRK KF1]MCM5554719.1 phosphate ABC transporter permease PstA [Pleomorphomonas sp. NRK KF1]
MTEAASTVPASRLGGAEVRKISKIDIGLKRRYAAERRFRTYGVLAVTIAICFLVALFSSIVSRGYTAFQQTRISMIVDFDPNIIAPDGDRSADAVMSGNAFRFDDLIAASLQKTLELDPNDEDALYDALDLLSKGSAPMLRSMIANDPSLIGTKRNVDFYATGDVDSFIKGSIRADIPESQRLIKDKHIALIEKLENEGALRLAFNTGLFTNGASTRPEMAGVGVALVGSLYMMLVVLVLSLPLGVAGSIYLEEFAPKNRWTDLIEVNINNLAAVPSIVYGLLGLAVFINFAHLPRSASLVGGLVLTLTTLPTIIIATRAALKAVPPSIREAGLGVGASKMQTVFHHVLPLAMPGVLTGTIIGLAHALGETAPLLMIGMKAFVVEYPTTPFDPATALPTQIYMWATEPERAFTERTSAAIIVLLAFLLAMNSLAIILRRAFERRW